MTLVKHMTVGILGLSLTTLVMAKPMTTQGMTQPKYFRAAVQAGRFLFVSGQNAQKANEVLSGNITQQTDAALGYIRKTLKEHDYSFKNVVNVNVFLAKQKDFAAFNKAYQHFFPHRPARSTSLGVLHQNKGALVEIALTAYK